MARLYYNAGGQLLRHLKTARELAKYPSPPAGAVGFVEYDAGKDAAVAGTIDREWNSTHSVVAGVLRRNGADVVFTPPPAAREVWWEGRLTGGAPVEVASGCRLCVAGTYAAATAQGAIGGGSISPLKPGESASLLPDEALTLRISEVGAVTLKRGGATVVHVGLRLVVI